LVTQLLDHKSGFKSILWQEPELDILQKYYDGSRESVSKISKIIKDTCGVERTGYSVRHKAGNVGLTRTNGSIRWTEDQEAQLVSLVGVLPTRKIATKLGRSLRSIYQKCDELKLSNRQRNDWYTGKEVCEILGVAMCTVNRWISDKKLKAKPHDGNRFLYHIERRDLKMFIKTYPSELTGRNIDIMQFVEILCGLNYNSDC
jgi:excisionase family DNA binding protein